MSQLFIGVTLAPLASALSAGRLFLLHTHRITSRIRYRCTFVSCACSDRWPLGEAVEVTVTLENEAGATDYAILQYCCTAVGIVTQTE